MLGKESCHAQEGAGRSSSPRRRGVLCRRDYRQDGGGRGAGDPPDRLGRAAAAARALGVKPPILLGYADLELDRLAPGVLREKFIRAIREHRPDVLITQDAFAPYETHPDHRAVALAASDAVTFATLPLMHPEHLEQGLAPHFVVEKYLYAENGYGHNKVVDITATIDRKLGALAEHRSQMEFLVEDVRRQAVLAGLELESILGEAIRDPMLAVSWAMRTQAAEFSQEAGGEYGEPFRYIRFHALIEGLLASQA